MSYDVSLNIATGPDTTTSVYWRNHTSNTAQMWRKAGCDIAEFDGKSAMELHASLEKAIAEIESNKGNYREFEPANRWGTLETTLDFLRDIRDNCAENPYTTVSVSR